eukprot:Skav203965  [mRNA]  locus=scaffold94:234150:247041:- [translate_table: standard]
MTSLGISGEDAVEKSEDDRGVRLQFSDDRFLHRVLQEAQKNGSSEQLILQGFCCEEDMHLKACRRRFELREAQRPQAERCPLLDEEEPGLHRPKPVEVKRPPRRRVTLAGPPPAAIDSYGAFCSRWDHKSCLAGGQLERCSYCSRQFRRELLASHEQTCGSASQPRRPVRAATSPMPRNRSTSTKGLAFTPPARTRDSGSTPSVRLKWGPPSDNPQPQVSTKSLLETGLISWASPADDQRLRAELEMASIQVLVLARVLVGRYCKGSASDVEPPIFNANGDRYDTTVDNVEAPSIFVPWMVMKVG